MRMPAAVIYYRTAYNPKRYVFHSEQLNIPVYTGVTTNL